MSSVGLAMMVGLAMATAERAPGISAGEFRWTYSSPVLEARAADGVEFISVKDRQGKGYGKIPWKLGLLDPGR